MSEKTVTLTFGKNKFDLDGKLFEFFEKREELGQKKYGVGKKNAGYRRDNLMDVIEEITDALTIINFAVERFEKVGDPMSHRDVENGQTLIGIRTTLVDVANQAHKLRSEFDWRYPTLTEESVKRAVVLETE